MNLPRMSLHVGDYRRDTAHLDAAEHGAYLLLIMHYWSTGGLPDDDQKLARIACMSARDWQKVRPTIAAFFKDGWRHGRIDSELVDAQARYERRAAAGKKGGRPAKDRSDESNAKAKLSDSLPNAKAPLTLTPKEEDSELRSDAGASPTTPVYTDSRHELWGEGVPILESLGVKAPKPIIGKWLRDAKDDAQSVLGAIQRARDARVIDAVPWITRALNTGGTNAATRQNGRGPSAITAAADDLVERFSGEDGGWRGPREDSPRLLPFRRGE